MMVKPNLTQEGGMKDWEEEYRKKQILAEEAAKLVKAGDYISFTLGREAYTIGLAIASRMGELQNVKVFQPFPGYDFGWYEPGWEDSFGLTIYMPTAISQQMMDDRRCDLEIPDILNKSESTLRESDIVITEVSPPDDKGFCSFGASLWNKREHINLGKLVLAEVNENLIRTFGDNFVHVSEIDYFIPHQATGSIVAGGSLAGRELKKPEPYLKEIAGYVSSLIKDGDTIQIGVGRSTEPLVALGIFDNKCDLGWHSEATPPGVIALVREGVINGKRKTINPGKAVVTSLGGASKEDMDWVNNNPLFYLADVSYLWDARTISAHDNMVAINNAISVDLTGQISSESIGYQIISASGGQTAFAIGALLSKGGRSITIIPSAARGGTASRIVSALEPGTGVTVPRNCADYVVTEYGIAHLRGKSLRRRAEELIAIAHPDFRTELKKKADKLYWPQK
jgi:4-hydroxybutyrate CoA-transferase